ncbi:MAG: agarase [Paenibacillaceae bacterium]|nr:agarase [Paenibacillaceae bacterium]
MVYDAGSAEFKSISIDVIFNKWGLNFNDAGGLSVCEAVYNPITGGYDNAGQVTMVRQLRPDLMQNRNTVKATYVSGPISAGTRYLKVMMPQASYYKDAAIGGDFQLDAITLKSNSAAFDPVTYLVDNMTDFAQFVQGANTGNLNVVNLSDISKILDARTFAALSYIRRNDATLSDQAMTYEAPAGKEFKTVYVEGYYNFAPSRYFEVWTSTDGVSFTNATTSSHYAKTPFLDNSQWIPTALKIEGLPQGTKYVQIRLPAYTSGELYGMKHPYITRASFGYAAPGANPTDPGDMVYPAETEIRFAPNPIHIDGVIETDANGVPSGDWSGALSASIAGEVDANNAKHSAEVYLKYDYDVLYVGAKIKDPTPMENTQTGANIWNGDNLEIFLGMEDLDYKLYPESKQTMLPSDAQIVLSGGLTNGVQNYIYVNGGITYPNIDMKLTADTDGKGYTIEAAVPLSALGIAEPWNNRQVIMNAVLNDGGFSKRGQWGWTTNGEPTKKARSLWGLAAFQSMNPPQEEISVNVAIENDTNLITVSGQTYGLQQRDVTVVVGDADGKLVHIDQAASDAQGHYSFTFPINDDVFTSGMYTATVGGDGIRHTNATSFVYTAAQVEPHTLAVTLTAGSMNVELGSDVTIFVGLTNASQVSAEDITLSYDPQIFAYKAGSAAAIGAHSEIIDSYADTNAGTIRVMLANLGLEHAFTGDGNILSLGFTAVHASGTGSFRVEQVTVADAQGSKQAGNTAGAVAHVSTQSDYTELDALIENVQGLYDQAVVGYLIGNYPQKAKAALGAAIAGAQTVADNASATNEQLEQAVAGLYAAALRFQSFVITSTTGDFGDPGYDVTEIAIIAGHYGVTSGHVRWNPDYDLDGDGEIGLYELSFIAKQLELY